MRPFILFAGLAWSAAIHSPLAAAECPAGPPAAWLVGGWTAEKVTVVIRPEVEGLLWSYVRAEGLETRTWGTKATAKAEGRVTTCPLLVVVPAGNVASGDPNDYDDTEDDRAKRPRIVIAKPFAIGKYEVTQAEWEAVMGDNPSDHKGKDLPVVRVTWRQVQGFLDKLNAQTGRAYRLPGEAEWEYAARAGSPGAYAFGDDPAPIGQYGWYRDNSGERIQPVGRLKPNAFGLHDTHGNVWEWTADCAGGNYASNLPADFAKDWQNSCYRVIRGGSILNYPKTLTVFSKGQLTQVNFNMNLGFRVARSLP